ncbi:MAG: type II secretion system protein GspG [Planctomycetes bacterium]|nr:type II secretion system protein GspG [Planctomycetota bacterium]
MKRHAKAFTLVELLLVVSILGILAALVIPTLTNASDGAKVSNAATSLANARKALQRYALEHGNTYPATAHLWEALSAKTTATGDIDAAGQFGPYLLSTPSNPWNQLGTIHEVAGLAAAAAATYASESGTYGWLYDPAKGVIAMPGFDDAAQEYSGN